MRCVNSAHPLPDSTRHPHRAACALHAQKYRISARFCRLSGNNAAKWGGSRRFACCTAPIRRPHCRTALFPTTCAVPIEHRNTKSMQSKRNRGARNRVPVNPRNSILPQRAPCGQYGKIRQKIHPGLSTPGAHHCHTSPPPTVRIKIPNT